MLASNRKIYLKILLLIFLIINVLSINSFAVVSQTEEFYVNDYANIINKDTEEYIINTNLNLYNKTGAQIVVVTVKNLEGKAIEEYATQLFRSFGIGGSSKNNGVLMLLALEEREFRIEVGYGLEGCLNDAKTGRIQDQYIIPYLKQNNWDDGIKNGYNAIIQVVANEYGVEVNANEPIDVQDSNVTNLVPMIIMLVFAVIIITKIKNGGAINISYGGYHHYPNYSRGRSFGNSSSSRSSRSSFGGGGSSGGGGSTRKF